MPRYLALDADTTGAAVLAVTVKNGAVTVDHAVLLPADPADPPLAAAAAVGAALKAALKSAGIKPAPLLVVVGRDRVIVKDVRHPPTPPADEPAIVRFQAVRDLADTADDVVMDYRPLGATPDGDRKAQAVFARKDVLAAARALADAAGLRLSAVTPRPFAVAEAVRRARGEEAGPVGVLVPGDRGGEFAVVDGADVLFTRTVPVSAFASADALAAELRRNRAVYAGQPAGGALRGIYVAESDLPGGWADQLGDGVTGFDPLAGFGAAADLIGSAQRGRFAGAVGVALSKAANPTLPVNFAAPRQPKADAGPARAKALLGVLAGLVLVVGLGFWGYSELDAADARLATLRADASRLDADTARLGENAARLAALDQFADREVVLLDELYDLAARVPDVDKVAVTEFDLAQIAVPKTRPGQKPAAGPPPPAAAFAVAVRSADLAVMQALTDTFGKADPFVVKFNRATAADSGGRGEPAYRLTGELLRRPPAEYARKLPTPASKPAPAGQLTAATTATTVDTEGSTP